MFTWADGRKYEGTWVNGRKNGNFTYTHTDGAIYTGVWENGEMISKSKA